MAAKPLILESLRGGFDDDTPEHLLPADACTKAENVEFFVSALGERRNGCDPIDVSSSDLVNETHIVHIVEWFPDNSTTNPELFVIAATPGTSVTVCKRVAGVWTTVTPVDAISPSAPEIFEIQSQALNGKLFFAYKPTDDTIDRMHVFDGTTLRPTGIAQPDAPVVVDEGVGNYSHIRFFRVRYVILDANSHVLVRSEPSESTMFAPDGLHAGAKIDRPALLGEGETDWEVEASENDVDFYRIATVPIGTTFYNDETLIDDGINTVPGSVTVPAGYVQLSNRAQILNMTGTISNGSYSDGVTFPIRGWVMYDGAGVYVPEGWFGHQPPAAGDVTFASQDVALVLEEAAGSGTHYASLGPLSEVVGTYLLLPGARFVIAVDDRLVIGSNWFDITRFSSVYWTPVHNDPGAGNDERLPLAVNNSLTLDNFAGGPLSGLAPAIQGAWIAFKRRRIYKMTRTGDVTRAYVALTLTTSRGALPGTIFSGLDSGGAACIYFGDPEMGPCAMGGGGLQRIVGLQKTWKRVNQNAASIIARGVYYPFKSQVHWWFALDNADSPNFKVVMQITELRVTEEGGLGRGLSTATGRITEAFSVGMVTELIEVDGVTTQRLRPWIGLTAPDLLQRCDFEGTTDDAGVAYIATVRSRSFLPGGLLNLWGTMNGALLADPNPDTNVTVRLVRDYGRETNEVAASLTPLGAEEQVIVVMNDLVMSESRAIQVEFTDAG